MSLFNFFKKQKKKQIEVQNREIKASFSNLSGVLEKIKKENKEKENKIFELIDEKINIFIPELNKKIDDVKNVNLDLKKAEDRFKFLTDNGRKKYLEFLEDFIHNMQTLEKKQLGKLINDTSRIFLSFSKSSQGNYERATILIGKEMRVLKDKLRDFSKELTDIFDSNKTLLESNRIISYVEKKLNQVNKNNLEYDKTQEKIKNIDKKIIQEKNKIDEIIKEIKKTKESKDYQENLQKKEKINFLDIELDKEILNLKQFIDFKKLASFFHSFQDQMDIVKEHRDDFKKAFKKDYGERIVVLLNESNTNTGSFSHKLNEITCKKNEINLLKDSLKKDIVLEFFKRMQILKENKEELSGKKNTLIKIKEKSKTENKFLKDNINNELKKINVIVQE